MKNNALVLGIVACFCTTVVAVVLVLVFAPGADVAPLLAALPPTVAALTALQVARGTDRKVEWLANGGTDAKVRAGIAEVVKPELLRDDVDLEADRAYRAAGPK